MGGWGDVSPVGDFVVAARPHPLASLESSRHTVRWSRLLVSVIALALVLAFLPGRSTIAPLIESDYCYLLIAAERFYNGLGLTSLQPVAPLQAWEWRYDWGFLTQWPAGYSVLIAGLRRLFGCSMIEACRIVSIVGCAAALAGWFAFIRRSVPSGVTGVLLAAVGGASCLTVGMLVNPSTDLILIATLPFVLLLICESLNGAAESCGSRTRLVIAGVLAGGLCWFRYASVFVPVAVGLLLVIEFCRKRLLFSSLIAFALSAALPILALVAVNAALGPASNASERFNLGSGVKLNVSLAALARAWWMFTDLGFYAHKPLAHWIFAILPFSLPLCFMLRPARRTLMQLLGRVELRLAVCVVGVLLAMIVCAACFFGAKFDYLGLERYYLPGRPLYFLIIAAPLMLVPRRVIRAALCVVLLALASWTVFQNWSPTFSRWVQADRPRTPQGAWSRPFQPNSDRLYQWVREQEANSSLLIFSNFHEYMALESGAAILPIPTSIESLAEMRRQAGRIRGVENPAAVVVLNPENLWRSYWMAEPEVLVAKLGLQPLPGAPPELQPYLFVPADVTTPLDHFTLISWN